MSWTHVYPFFHVSPTPMFFLKILNRSFLPISTSIVQFREIWKRNFIPTRSCLPSTKIRTKRRSPSQTLYKTDRYEDTGLRFISIANILKTEPVLENDHSSIITPFSSWVLHTNSKCFSSISRKRNRNGGVFKFVRFTNLFERLRFFMTDHWVWTVGLTV